jgi:hypothetical protein
MAKPKRPGRHYLTLSELVLLYLYGARDNTALNNTRTNATKIIRDPIHNTHPDVKYTTRQCRNHMHDCRDRLEAYLKRVRHIQQEFDRYYTPNDQAYYMQQAADFIRIKREKLELRRVG